jgi:phosphohistidine phosphatase
MLDRSGMHPVIQHQVSSILPMFLYIVRHAWAYEHGDPRWPDDSKRPLEAEGAERFRRVVELLAARDFAPEVIATSPYLRCRQTADIVAAGTPQSPGVVDLPALTPGSDFEELMKWSRKQKVASICWVGHSPDVERLAAALISDGGDANVRFAKGSVAAIKIQSELERGAGELHWHATAKLLGV